MTIPPAARRHLPALIISVLIIGSCTAAALAVSRADGNTQVGAGWCVNGRYERAASSDQPVSAVHPFLDAQREALDMLCLKRAIGLDASWPTRIVRDATGAPASAALINHSGRLQAALLVALLALMLSGLAAASFGLGAPGLTLRLLCIAGAGALAVSLALTLRVPDSRSAQKVLGGATTTETAAQRALDRAIARSLSMPQLTDVLVSGGTPRWVMRYSAAGGQSDGFNATQRCPAAQSQAPRGLGIMESFGVLIVGPLGTPPLGYIDVRETPGPNGTHVFHVSDSAASRNSGVAAPSLGPGLVTVAANGLISSSSVTPLRNDLFYPPSAARIPARVCLTGDTTPAELAAAFN